MLDLNQTAVGDAGVRLIFDLPRITSLNLHGTRVTDAGLAELANRTSHGPLQSLVVTGARVTPAGVDELRKKLPQIGVMGPGDRRMPRPRAAPLQQPQSPTKNCRGDRAKAGWHSRSTLPSLLKDAERDKNDCEARLTPLEPQSSLAPTGPRSIATGFQPLPP